MNGVLWGLAGAILIGGSDCIARVTARKVSSSILFLYIMGLSFIVLSVHMLYAGDWPDWHWWAWTASFISGVLNLIALYYLYVALSRGPVAVASPAASTFTVLLVGMNALAGEAWSLLQLLAVVIVFLGIVMLARRTETGGIDDGYDAKWLRTTALYGLVAATAVSLRMFMAQEASAVIGAMQALYLNRLFALMATLIVLVVLWYRHSTLSWPTVGMTKLVLIQAILETCALGAFLIGSAGDGRISAAIGFSAFAAATALFAWFWLGERIGLRRGVWITVVAGGVVLAVVGSP